MLRSEDCDSQGRGSEVGRAGHAGVALRAQHEGHLGEVVGAARHRGLAHDHTPADVHDHHPARGSGVEGHEEHHRQLGLVSPRRGVVVGVHAEIGGGNKYTNAIIGMKGSDPFTCEVRRVFWQSSAANVVLLESESVNATNHIVIRDCLTNQSWKLKQIDTTGGTSSWDLKNITLECWIWSSWQE